MKYIVTFTQCYDYEVDADNEDDAITKAEKEFEGDMRSPIANTVYDYVDVEEQEHDN